MNGKKVKLFLWVDSIILNIENLRSPYITIKVILTIGCKAKIQKPITWRKTQINRARTTDKISIMQKEYRWTPISHHIQKLIQNASQTLI